MWRRHDARDLHARAPLQALDAAERLGDRGVSVAIVGQPAELARDMIVAVHEQRQRCRVLAHQRGSPPAE